MRRPKRYVVDLTHFEGIDDPELNVPGPARRLGMNFDAITEQVTAVPVQTMAKTSIACRCRPGRRPCPGRILGRQDQDTAEIFWWCPHCGEQGVIYNWAGTRWDRSSSAPAADAAVHRTAGAGWEGRVDDGRPGPAPAGDAVAVARLILERLDELNGEDLLVDDEEYGIIIRGVVEGVEAHLRRNDVAGPLVASAVRDLLAHARNLYIARWLRHAFEDEDGVVDEEREARDARVAFEIMLRRRDRNSL